MPRIRARSKVSAVPAPIADANGHAGEVGPPAQILFEFPHGLGDLLQFSIVLSHLKSAQPDTSFDVCCADGYRLSASGFERERFGFSDRRFKDRPYPQRVRVEFGDCAQDLAGIPSSKAYRAIAELLRMPARAELFTYTLPIGELARARVKRYLSQLAGGRDPKNGRWPVVLIHYQGTSSRMNKDLTHETAGQLVAACHQRKRAVALLDFDQQSPLTDQRTVHSPWRGLPVWGEVGHPDPETMAAMIDQCEAFIGIDSGPLHVAAVTTTPCLGIWTHHHPIRFFDFSRNVVHLVPIGHKRLAPGPRSLQTFTERYRHVVYGDVTSAAVEELHKLLSGEVEPAPPASEAIAGLKATGYGEQYYTEHVLGGLDYLGHGDWQRNYGVWLADALGWKGQRVLDVGCACGSIMRGLGEAGVIVEGCDVSEFMVARGRAKWPDMAALLHVCDAVNLHLWPPDSWDGLHCAQVAEHWRPELVPFILQELARVTRPGGLFFCCLDTTELFERHGRKMESEDPTHLCVKPLAWWTPLLDQAGWDVVTADQVGALEGHALSFLARYDWSFFVARKRRG